MTDHGGAPGFPDALYRAKQTGPIGKIQIQPVPENPGMFIMHVWGHETEGITDIIEGPLRFLIQRALNWAEPGTKLGVRKVRK